MEDALRVHSYLSLCINVLAESRRELVDKYVVISILMWHVVQLISSSVQKVVVDAKIGPPSYEKGLARDLISVVSLRQSF